ncbi:MAG: family 43 glycosylhydrolase [Bacteroidaceae bacterium]|nr:family 43 glycosylhydrolase [Bacteroidaceae bacterium]
MKIAPILFSLLFSISTASAQNPIIKGQFTADPTARVFNGKVYLFPSHDIPPCTPDLIQRKWFCMEDYHVFSSENLVEWTDHGVIVTQNKVPWVQPDSYTMWAPDCVEKEGRYYFFFPAQPKGGRGFGIGVAFADKPEGPYMPMWRNIEGVNGIDPCVLKGLDGKWYIYWGGGGLMCARLKDDFSGLHPDEKVQEVEFMGRKMKRTGVAVDAGLPEGFKEGPFAFTRNGKYYLTYPWVRGEKGEPGPDGKPSDNHTETLAYAMSDSPYGPFEYKGLIMEEWPNGCWTNHHSLMEYKGEWYLFYHHNDYSPNFDKNRSVCVDKVHFNPDGTIQLVKPTLRGVGITDAHTRIQIDRYSDISGKAHIEYLDTTNYFDGWKTVFSKGKGTIIYNNVNFGKEPVKEVVLQVKSTAPATVKIYASTQLLATIKTSKSADWTYVRQQIKNAPTGTKDMKVEVSTGGRTEIDWLSFDAAPLNEGAFSTGRYRNILAEFGYPQKEIDSKLNECFHNMFEGPNKVYFEVGNDMAYISDIKNNDVRTEGMSYGMMAAVQFGKKDIFDRLWRWAKKYMQHQSGNNQGYFAWSCKTDGTRNAQGAASDGELYFVTSLIFASNLWGNDTGINYLAEAQNILNCSMMKSGMDNTAPLINLQHKLINFTPDRYGNSFTDPSYHIPAFYEVWAQYANDGRSNFWKECAATARQYLHNAINSNTGLNPDYSNYDGTLQKTGRMLGDAFRFDSWRVPMNIALDYSWSCADRQWQQNYAKTIHTFFEKQGIDTYVDQYNTDGTQVSQILLGGTDEQYRRLRHSIGLVSTLAAASLATTDAEQARLFISKFWQAKHEPYDDGYFDAYYDGFLRLFAMMHLSGNYRIITPQKP